jgi:hypothetical protein
MMADGGALAYFSSYVMTPSRLPGHNQARKSRYAASIAVAATYR